MGRKDKNRPGFHKWVENSSIKTSNEEFIYLRTIVNLTSYCWEWVGSIATDGYGKMKRKGKTWRAHRFSYTIFKGEIPLDTFVCHKCDNPSCVNPDHLFLGTHLDNELDKDKKGRRSPSPSTSHPESIPRGEKSGRSTLSDKQAEEAYLYKLNNQELSNEEVKENLKLSCSVDVLNKLFRGITRKHLRFQEKFGIIKVKQGVENIYHKRKN